MAAPPTTTAGRKCQPIHISSTNSSYVKNVIWKWARWNRRKWLWSKKRWQGRKQLYIKQLLSTGVGKKKSENSLQSMSTIQSSTSEAESSLDVDLFIELVRQFPDIWNPKLNYFKDHAKKKNAWNQINTALGGSFSSKIFKKIFLIKE